MGFSEAALRRLATAGWREGRSVDLTPFVLTLRLAGYDVFPSVEDFFRRYGGLELVWTDEDGAPTATLTIDPEGAVRAMPAYFEREDYPARVGCRVCPLFWSRTWHHVYYMSEDGKVYCGNEDALAHVGSDADDAMEAICSGREMTPIPERSEDAGE